MGTWVTYDLADFLLFSPETYDRMFERTNEAVWPLHLATLALGAAIPMLLQTNSVRRGRLAAAILSASWLAVAWAFHLERYAAINWAAPWFAVLFGVEALLLIWFGVLQARLAGTAVKPLARRVGLALFGLGLAGHPILAPLTDHSWMRSEFFGIAPDPTAVCTLGILLLAGGNTPWLLWIGPVVWCLLTGLTLWALGSPTAALPPLAAMLALAAAIGKPRYPPASSSSFFHS